MTWEALMSYVAPQLFFIQQPLLLIPPSVSRSIYFSLMHIDMRWYIAYLICFSSFGCLLSLSLSTFFLTSFPSFWTVVSFFVCFYLVVIDLMVQQVLRFYRCKLCKGYNQFSYHGLDIHSPPSSSLLLVFVIYLIMCFFKYSQ